MRPLRPVAIADHAVSAAAPELVAVESLPRMRKCTERAAKVTKAELEELLSDAGLGGPEQGRATARILKCDEKTLRRWRDPLCGKDLAPDEIRIILRGRAAEMRRDSASVRRAS
jgi:hypothetical protein